MFQNSRSILDSGFTFSSHTAPRRSYAFSDIHVFLLERVEKKLELSKSHELFWLLFYIFMSQ